MAGIFCVGLGGAIVFDVRRVASRFVAAARDEGAQRVVNKIVGWGFVGVGVLFVAVVVVEGFSALVAE
ncbi:hypothetical protein [Streptomyces sp. WAC 06738]|uniref:hypothetical protein n=1 Tax=Streptomyces sp. WAC 06738 TaxID=2203210 RepID=UPI0013DFD01B|nr:hypothetical protein [Streptomyces sp. WAC 06738]